MTAENVMRTGKRKLRLAVGFYFAKIIRKVMSEVIEILKRIESKLDEMDKRLRRIEEEFFDELSEDELRELDEDLRAYREGKMEMIDLEEIERELQSQAESKS